MAAKASRAARRPKRRLDDHERPAGAAIALFAEIALHPDDEEVREVLADQLLERGDPRGELLMLQLSGSDPKRERALIQDHATEWLGPLAPLVRARDDWRHYRFARGFPVAIRLVDTPQLAGALERSVGDPAWATVTQLDVGVAQALPTALLRHPVMRSLDHLGGLSSDMMRELLTWKRIPYATLHAWFPDFDGGSQRRSDLEALVNARAKLPQLRALELYSHDEDGPWQTAPSEYRWIWKSWLGRQLDCFGAEHGLRQLGAWIEEVEEHAPELGSLKLSAEDMWTEWVELTRDARGRFSIATVHSPDPFSRFHHTTTALPAALSSLPRGGLTRLRFANSAPMPRQLAAVQAAVAQAKIELELPTASAGSRRSARRTRAGSSRGRHRRSAAPRRGSSRARSAAS